MANKKITELTAIDAVVATDILAVVDDPTGVPVTKKATQTQILAPCERTANKDQANGYAGLDANADLALSKIFPASAATRLLGRGSSGGAGDWQEITIGSGLSMVNQVLSATAVGGGAAWTFVSQNDLAGLSQKDQIDLSTYNEVMIQVKYDPSTAAVLQVLVSTDNGSTFLNTSGDYIAIGSDFTGANDTTMSSSPNTDAERYCVRFIALFNVARPKFSWQLNHQGGANGPFYWIPTTTALNAIRVRVHTGTFTTGTLWVYGRT